MAYEIVAKTGRHVWVRFWHPEKPEYGFFVLPNGVKVQESLAYGRADEVPFVPEFVREQGQKWGDLLWTTQEIIIASDQFVEALAGMTNFVTYPVRVRTKRGEVHPGYQGLAVKGVAGVDDVFRTSEVAHWKFGISDRAWEALQAAGATDFNKERLHEGYQTPTR